MLALLLPLLLAAPDGGTPSWVITRGAPTHAPLFATRPEPERNRFGRVLPAFATVEAMAKSSHPLLAHLSVEQRASLDTLVALSKAPRPELAELTVTQAAAPDGGIPADFLRLGSDGVLSAWKGTPTVVRVTQQGCCDGEGALEDIGLTKTFSVRVQRDARGKVTALATRTERFVTHDNHGGKVTEKNASERTVTRELLTFDAQGRLTGRLRFSRADNELRYLPYVDVQAWTFTWADEQLVNARGVVIADDDDALDLRITDEVLSRSP